MKKFLIFMFFAVFLFAKNILVINSYSIKLLWTREELNGILSVLEDRPDIKLYIEFMDTKVFRPTPERLDSFYKYLNSKYKNIPIDIVITTDDNALNFIRKYKNTPIFQKAKIFFAGVNNLTLKDKLEKNIYSGVFEKKEPLANLRLLKKVVRNLKYVYVVSDNSTSGDSVIREYKEAFKNINNLIFIYINSKNLEEVIEKIKNSPKNSGMLLLTPLSFYLHSQHINYKYAIALISQYFNHPIVIHSDLYVKLKDNNIIGGKVTDGFLQGYIVAKKVLAYLDGIEMEKIGFTFEKANKLYLNVKNLEKFGINAYSLGFKNVKFVNEPNNFYYKYKAWIIGFFGVLVIVIFIAVVLYIKNRQLKIYNKVMKKLNQSLEEKIVEAVDELKKREDKNISNEYLRKFIKNIIFQFKYPIEKLNDNSIESEYLKEKIVELESLLGDNNKEEIDLRNLLENTISKTNLKDKILIIGDELKIYADKKQIEKIFLNFFESLDNVLGKKYINEIIIRLNKFRIDIEVKHSLLKFNIDDISKNIFNSIYLSTVFLKYCINGDFELNINKNSLIYEIKFS